jgi:hypothetical protein
MIQALVRGGSNGAGLRSRRLGEKAAERNVLRADALCRG